MHSELFCSRKEDDFMRRTIFVPLLITLALLAIMGGIGYWIFNSYYYYTTDDAQVNGQIVTVTAPIAGTLSSLSVKQGDQVTLGQSIGTITPLTGNAVTLTSPFAGTIVQTPAVQGQAVSPGLAVSQVADLSHLNVIAYVDENALNNVKVDQVVDIHIDAYGGTSYTGKVVQIVQAAAGQFSLLPTTDFASGNFTKVGQRVPVIISLDNGNGGNDLVPGMSAEVTIHIH
jgi:multidrug resistance efflux pump